MGTTGSADRKLGLEMWPWDCVDTTPRRAGIRNVAVGLCPYNSKGGWAEL